MTKVTQVELQHELLHDFYVLQQTLQLLTVAALIVLRNINGIFSYNVYIYMWGVFVSLCGNLGWNVGNGTKIKQFAYVNTGLMLLVWIPGGAPLCLDS